MRAGFNNDAEREQDQLSMLKPPTAASEAAKESPGREGPEGGLAPAQSAVLGLQRSHGNQFVVQMLQKKCACGGTCANCSAEREAESQVTGASVAAGITHPGSGESLDPGTRGAMEARLGQNFADVRVHRDGSAASAAEALQAQAFTVGKDVFFAAGKYRGDSQDPILAHELTHVAQQTSGAGGPVSNGSDLEAQAESAERATSDGGGGRVEIGSVGRGIQRKADDATMGTVPAHAPTAKKPSFFERIGHGIASAAETVGTGIKTAGKAIARGAEAVGHAAVAAGEAVWSGIEWIGKQLWSKVTGVFERIMHWLTRLPERVKRLVLNLWEGVKSMKPWALKWWESLGKADTWIDFLQWLGRNMIYVLEVGGFGEAYETAMEFVKFNTRPLSGGEIGLAQAVFGGSIRYELVRVDEHAALGPAFTHREYTSFHTINGWGHIDSATMIHELTHVWQYERAGAMYMAQALHAQFKSGQGAYRFKVQDLRDAKLAGRGILSFNREQQAQIVEEFYLIKTQGTGMVSDGGPADLPLYAHFVKEVSTHSKAELLV